MRFLLLGFALALGCSSSDDAGPTGTPGVNACTQSGGLCAVNIPFTCTDLTKEAATDSVRATACGKSEGDIVVDIACCIPRATPLDTGMVEDTSVEDSASDASDGSSSDGTTDGTSSDGTSSEVSTDASEAG